MDLTMNETAREELLETIEGISKDDFNGERGGANHWTLKQTVEHISIMEKAVVDMIQDAIGSGDGATTTSSEKDDTTILLTPTDEAATVEDTKEMLAASQAELREAVSQLSEADKAKRISLHPSIATMRLDEWVSFLTFHEMNHVSEINGIKQKI